MNTALDDFVDILSTSPERFYDNNQNQPPELVRVSRVFYKRSRRWGMARQAELSCAGRRVARAKEAPSRARRFALALPQQRDP